MSEWHIITGEYPPQPGGVSDYTRLVAMGLAAAGDTVHIWCPSWTGSAPHDPGVYVHRDLGTMMPADLRRVGRMLNEFPKPRRVLVQWVPHAFGFRSANIPFSMWICSRAWIDQDTVDLMIHEAYLPLPQRRLKHTALAIAHRLMLALMLGAASRVWTAIPHWEEYCRPYSFGRTTPFTWLPVVSNIVPNSSLELVATARGRYAQSCRWLIGHFGTCGGEIGVALDNVIPELLNHHEDCAVLLMGRDSAQARAQLVRNNPALEHRIHATGALAASEISSHISACDLMFQPYPDGATSRRGSLMAALSHGKPVVTTVGHLTEHLWISSRSAAMAPAGNYRELIACTEKLLADPNEMERLAETARTIYERRFSLPNLIALLRDPTTGFTVRQEA